MTPPEHSGESGRIAGGTEPQIWDSERAWEIFENAAMPPSAGDTQRRDMHMAFLSGAHTLLWQLAQMQLLPSAVVRSIRDEIEVNVERLVRAYLSQRQGGVPQ